MRTCEHMLRLEQFIGMIAQQSGYYALLDLVRSMLFHKEQDREFVLIMNEVAIGFPPLRAGQ